MKRSDMKCAVCGEVWTSREIDAEAIAIARETDQTFHEAHGQLVADLRDGYGCGVVTNGVTCEGVE